MKGGEIMAKGVIIYPVQNTSITIDHNAVVTYGIKGHGNGYGLVYQRNNNIDIPNAYIGKISSTNCEIIVIGNGRTNCRLYTTGVASDSSASWMAISATGVYDRTEYNRITIGIDSFSYAVPSSVLEFDAFDSIDDMAQFIIGESRKFPITYQYTNSTVSGPAEAVVGDIVTVFAMPDVGYGITDASTQILVTNNDIAVPYTWDATNKRITFTMPDPS